MLTFLDEFLAATIEPRFESLDDRGVHGVAVFERDRIPFAKIEYRQDAHGQITELTVIACGRGLRIVASREAFATEPVLARFAAQIEQALRARRTR